MSRDKFSVQISDSHFTNNRRYIYNRHAVSFDIYVMETQTTLSISVAFLVFSNHLFNLSVVN